MKCVFSTVIAFALVFLFVGQIFADDLEKELGFAKTFQGEKFGTVTFDHLSHLNQDCVQCHTTMKESGVTKDFGHGFCKDCHKETEAAPTKCLGCHVK